MNLRHAVALANSICDSVSQGRRVGAVQPARVLPRRWERHAVESESAWRTLLLSGVLSLGLAAYRRGPGAQHNGDRSQLSVICARGFLNLSPYQTYTQRRTLLRLCPYWARFRRFGNCRIARLVSLIRISINDRQFEIEQHRKRAPKIAVLVNPDSPPPMIWLPCCLGIDLSILENLDAYFLVVSPLVKWARNDTNCLHAAALRSFDASINSSIDPSRLLTPAAISGRASAR